MMGGFAEPPVSQRQRSGADPQTEQATGDTGYCWRNSEQNSWLPLGLAGSLCCACNWGIRMVTSCRVVVALLVLMSAAGLFGVHAAHAARSELLQRPVDALLLEQHNVFRQEERAANIYKMRWNSSVEAAASRWVSRCDFKHELGGEYGENLFYDSNKGEDKEVLLGGLEAWHEEKRAWRYTSASCGAACHYTQMVWSSTTELGCAFKRCPALRVGSRNVANAMYLVCFYYPRGNWIGEFPFKTGAPCSKCGSDTCQTGLCVPGSSSYQTEGTQSDMSEPAALMHAPQQLVWRTSYEQHSASAQSDTGSHSYSYSRTVQRGPDGAGYAHAEGHYSSPQGSQGFSQAHYSRGGLKNLATHLLKDAELERRDRSPLELLREEDHWCRDRLPSCRTWTHDCQKSKSVYLACPRSCGHCNSQSEKSRDLTPGSLQETVPRPEPLRQSLHPQLDSAGGQLVVVEQQQQQQQQQHSHLRHHPQQQQQQNRQWLRQQQPVEDQQLLPAPAEGLRLAQQRHPGRDGDLGQNKKKEKYERRQQDSERKAQRREKQHKKRQQKQQQRQQQKQQQRQQKLQQRQQQQRIQLQQQQQQHPLQQQQHHQQDQRSRNGTHVQMHPRYRTVDKRAEQLAENLRRVAHEGRCEDDIKYKDSCSYWVAMGFCHGNELVTTVYCRKSCRTC